MSDPLYKYMHCGSNGDWMVSQTMIKIRHGFVWGKYLKLFYFWTVELISVKLTFNSKYKFMHVAMVSKSLTEERVWRIPLWIEIFSSLLVQWSQTNTTNYYPQKISEN